MRCSSSGSQRLSVAWMIFFESSSFSTASSSFALSSLICAEAASACDPVDARRATHLSLALVVRFEDEWADGDRAVEVRLDLDDLVFDALQRLLARLATRLDALPLLVVERLDGLVVRRIVALALLEQGGDRSVGCE